jgi:hypothetical protein
MEDYSPSSWMGHQASRSYECLQALREHAQDPLRGAYNFYRDYISRKDSKYINESTSIIVGIDPRNPPAETELLKKLEDFRASKYFCQPFITEEVQELRYTSNSFGTKPPMGATGLMVSLVAETQNLLYAAQWDMYTGPEHPARIEIETTDGRVLSRYFDYTGYQPDKPIEFGLGAAPQE